MSTLRRILSHANFLNNNSRFERYYSGVLQSGQGFPTADEARKDLNQYDRAYMPYGWPR
ncbi:MAG TPA: hypothetical protein VFQ54_03375 [Thermomicrobiales bacterium]|nr:hypothetical protein [Thermomicrobiales bacterium]